MKPLALAALAAGALLADASAESVLDAYVDAQDETFAWRVRARHEIPGADIAELRVDSQTWRGVLWKHRLHLIRPEGVETGTTRGLLVIAGGRWRDEYDTASDAPLDDDAALFIAIADRLETIVAVVEQVPFQPIFGLREDELIAHTFEQYLASGERDWPLLLPMVKAAVRAMDAAQAFTADEWGIPLESFTVLGGSKRGWTTWLTGAVDPRAAALVPIAIDVLNFEAHMPHQRDVWGQPSAQIAPYTRRGLDDVLSSPEGRSLREIVDPYSHRERLIQPKLIVIGTNDPYFPLDSLNLYWPGLPAPKNVLYLPNSGHDADDLGRLIPTLDAFHRATAAGRAMPVLASELAVRANARLALCVDVDADSEPLAVTVWSADSEDTDFRDERFVPAEAGAESNALVHEFEPPASGYRALFAEALLDGPNGRYWLSSDMRVIDESGIPPFDGSAPENDPGACP